MKRLRTRVGSLPVFFFFFLVCAPQFWWLGTLPAQTHEGVVSLTNKPHTAPFFASYNLKHEMGECANDGAGSDAGDCTMWGKC